MTLEILHRKSTSDYYPPILFVHGAWHSAWCWDEFFLPHFANKGFDSYALSLSGHGKSSISSQKKFSALRIQDYVDDLYRVTVNLTRQPILVGHSMGALVVQKYIESHHSRGAVLLAPPPLAGVYKVSAKLALQHPLRFIRTNLSRRLYHIVSDPKMAQKILFPASLCTNQFMNYHQKLEDESYFAFLDMLFLNLAKPERNQTPLLILGAENDYLFSPKEVKKLSRAYGTSAKIFANTTHDMMLGENWREIADYIIRWIDQPARTTSTSTVLFDNVA